MQWHRVKKCISIVFGTGDDRHKERRASAVLVKETLVTWFHTAVGALWSSIRADERFPNRHHALVRDTVVLWLLG